MSIYKQQPTIWPTLGFSLLRAFQFSCSVIVIGVLGYFIYHLTNDGYPVPWEFIILDAVSSFTLINIFISLILLCCRRLPPMVVLITDGLLMLFWVLAFALLARAMGKTTFQACTSANWGVDGGIYICHMYKCLYAFSCLSWISHLATFTVASIVRRRPPAHVYEPAVNPANLSQQTAYAPQSTYGAPPPPVYTMPYDHTSQNTEYRKNPDYYN